MMIGRRMPYGRLPQFPVKPQACPFFLFILKKVKEMAKSKKAKMIKSPDGNKLAIVNPDAAGIDIADKEMQVCVPEDRDGENNRCFGSFTCDLNIIVEWLRACRITTVAMEATGIYYLQLFLKLQDAADAEWLMLLHRYGLLKPCYQPGNAARQIRNLCRQRNNIIRSADKQIQYMQKAMEQMNLKLSTVITDITGMSGRDIINAILAGKRDPAELASLAPRLLAKRLPRHLRAHGILTCYSCSSRVLMHTTFSPSRRRSATNR